MGSVRTGDGIDGLPVPSYPSSNHNGLLAPSPLPTVIRHPNGHYRALTAKSINTGRLLPLNRAGEFDRRIAEIEKMVAISLYRGNLHRVPELPRRWLMPPRTISVRDFRSLLEKRSRSLARLQPSETAAEATGNDEELKLESADEEGMGDNGCLKPDRGLVDSSVASVEEAAEKDGVVAAVVGIEGGKEIEAVVGPSSSGAAKSADNCEKGDPEAAPNNGIDDIELRKNDLEKKLVVLNDKKHHLVQMLKQILNAEEELKKRSSAQLSSVRASFPSPADPSVETGSAMKATIPRMTVDVNFGGVTNGGKESEEFPSHSVQAHRPSPSSTSPFNRPMHGFFQNSANVSQGISSSASLGSMTASPSRFAPPGHPGQLMVSLSGAPFLASSPSPSPAGSGGASSIFRDAHLTSP
ncbi:tRNA (Ile)-lysidine synthase [Wolffia australiana]